MVLNTRSQNRSLHRQSPDDLPQAADYTVQQPLHLYTEQDHQTWRTLYARQAVLNGRACDEYLRGLQQLRMSHERVPDFNELNDILRAHTGLANRRGEWFGSRGVFSIIWPTAVSPVLGGCVVLNKWITCRTRTAFTMCSVMCALLINPVFADYMQAYGEGGPENRTFAGIADAGAGCIGIRWSLVTDPNRRRFANLWRRHCFKQGRKSV